jgi:enoyl-CoA hydratase
MPAEALEYVLYETPADKVARIVLNRPPVNAQNTQFLYELNAAFDRAAHDEAISVIILAANGKHFSAGHDLAERVPGKAMADFDTVGTVCGFECAGAEAQMSREEEIYIGFSNRWRNISKPTIAAVQGKCIAGDDASFSDPTVSFGVGGVEYFAHVQELGARRAKEILFTADAFTAQQALEWGMVNRVVPRDQLEAATLALAVRIAEKPRFALQLVKKAVNGVVDAQGREVSMNNAFHLHQLAHTHNLKVFDMLMDPTGLPPETRKAMERKAPA